MHILLTFVRNGTNSERPLHFHHEIIALFLIDCPMDPSTGIQLAASAVQLVDMAFKVFTHLYQYYRDVRDAPSRSEDVRRQLDALMDILNDVQELFERNQNTTFSPAISKELSTLHRLLTELALRSTPKETTGFRKLHWPFQEKENIDIINKIERCKANLITHLNLHQTYSLLLFKNYMLIADGSFRLFVKMYATSNWQPLSSFTIILVTTARTVADYKRRR